MPTIRFRFYSENRQALIRRSIDPWLVIFRREKHEKSTSNGPIAVTFYYVTVSDSDDSYLKTLILFKFYSIGGTLRRYLIGTDRDRYD